MSPDPKETPAQAGPPPDDQDPPPDPAEAEALIRRCLVEEEKRLKASAGSFLRRFGLATGSAIVEMEEMYQEASMRALEGVSRYRPRQCAPRFWIEGILRNIARHRLDKLRRHPLASPTQEAGAEAALDGEDFDRLVRVARLGEEPLDPEAQAIAQQELEAYLAPLSPPDREVVALSVLCGLDYKEVAARMATTPGAARTRLSRALKKLRHTARGRR